jgi:tRNA dimethylallyltransferase
MLAAGFLDEVRRLRARGNLNPDLPSMRSVGYRQAWDHMQGATSFDEFRASAIAASRQLAKRQITWLRSMGDALPIDPLREGAQSELRSAIGRWIE